MPRHKYCSEKLVCLENSSNKSPSRLIMEDILPVATFNFPDVKLHEKSTGQSKDVHFQPFGQKVSGQRSSVKKMDT